MYHAMTFKDGEKELMVSDLFNSNGSVKVISRYTDSDNRVRQMEMLLGEDSIKQLRNHLSKQLKKIKQPVATT